MKKIFNIKIDGYIISIMAVLVVGVIYFLLGHRSFYLIRGSIITLLIAAVILEYMSYRVKNVIDYFRNPLTIVLSVTDSLKYENLPSKEREQLIFLKKTLDNMEKMYNEIT